VPTGKAKAPETDAKCSGAAPKGPVHSQYPAHRPLGILGDPLTRGTDVHTHTQVAHDFKGFVCSWTKTPIQGEFQDPTEIPGNKADGQVPTHIHP
jgi:hypothetical protein